MTIPFSGFRVTSGDVTLYKDARNMIGITIGGGRVYTMDRQTEPKPVERVRCFDFKTGEPIWTRSYPADYKGLDYGSGPRGSVTIHDGRVYTLGAVVYATKMFNFVPGKFGFHEVWHSVPAPCIVPEYDLRSVHRPAQTARFLLD